MVWVLPTLDDLDARWPGVFSQVDTALAQSELDQAISEILPGDWIERDRTPAVLNLVAHRLSSSGAGVPVGTGSGSLPAGAVLKAREVGDVRSEFSYPAIEAAKASAGADDDLSSTVYGRRFLELMRLNFPGFRALPCR